MPSMEDDETIFKAHAAASRALHKERAPKIVLVCDCIREDGKPDKSCRSYAECAARSSNG